MILTFKKMKSLSILSVYFTFGLILLSVSSLKANVSIFEYVGPKVKLLEEEDLPLIGYKVQVQSEVNGELILECAINPNTICDL